MTFIIALQDGQSADPPSGGGGSDWGEIEELPAPGFRGVVPGVERAVALHEVLAVYRGSIPAAHRVMPEPIADGDLVVTCCVALGTERDPLSGRGR